MNLPIEVSTAKASVDAFLEIWDHERFHLQEQCYALFINKSNMVITWECLGTGDRTSLTLDMQLLITVASDCRASKLIIAHNHTEGGATPSPEDEETTQRVMYIIEYLNVELIDHIILSGEGYYSFKEHDLILVTA